MEQVQPYETHGAVASLFYSRTSSKIPLFYRRPSPRGLLIEKRSGRERQNLKKKKKTKDDRSRGETSVVNKVSPLYRNL